MKRNYNYTFSAFTLIEIMMGVLIFSLVIIGGFKAYSGVLIGKVKLIESTDIQKEAFYFSEKFFEEIKKGGTIDYEEYFNREIVGTGITDGHYNTPTGFGNFGWDFDSGLTFYGSEPYHCRSDNGRQMTGTGCIEDFNKNDSTSADDRDYSGDKQRYLQYARHFIDYNSNFNNDSPFLTGDEDGDGSILGDDDDEYLGEGPDAFSSSEVNEIYLISADKKIRTLFRWETFPDETDGTKLRGTIKFLKLEGKDWGMTHDQTGSKLYDGIIDTWLIHKDFSGMTNNDPLNSIIAGSPLTVDNWQPLFGDNINVSDVKFFAYPNKDLELAWKDSTPGTNIAPYIRIQMTLSPSYGARRGIKGKIPEIKINTTISLTDIYSR